MNIPERTTNPTSLVFDLETIPADIDKLTAIMPAFEPDSRLKDPAKIAENLQKQKDRYLERAALDWKTARIVLIGVSNGKEYLPITGTEREILYKFFSIVENSIDNHIPMGGHNTIGFDLPLIVNRARALRQPMPEGMISSYHGKPSWNDIFFDTLSILTFGDRQRMDGNGVDDVARACGLPSKLGDGGAFPALWSVDREAAIAYNRRDCEIEVEIAKMCGFKF